MKTEFVDRPLLGGPSGRGIYAEERVALLETLTNDKAILLPWKVLNSIRQSVWRMKFKTSVRIRSRKNRDAVDLYYVWLEDLGVKP
jgi:hypothetical protein